jgi:hypothetical protein
MSSSDSPDDVDRTVNKISYPNSLFTKSSGNYIYTTHNY